MNISYIKERQLDLQIRYPDRSSDASLKKLKENNRLEDLLDEHNCDFQNIMKVKDWVSSKWENDCKIFKAQAEKRSIPKTSESTDDHRGIEYSLILKACLRSLGFTVRTLFLEPGDHAEEGQRKKHVLFEAYLSDRKKWFLIDPIFDIVVQQNEVPLNAVEFQQALVHEEELELGNTLKLLSSVEYLEWIGPYLFYFTTSLNKGGGNICSRILGSKKKLTLVPVGIKPFGKFQKSLKKRNRLITHSIADFYVAPKS
ncbi:hypothetical protein C8P64_0795 [Christiangramia gaetbulicola]|uniref:Transglutaminase superfamily protein n=1 Tax=Christiangramia gaetbulicola TaxID=703340 RepID=A0A2T6ALW0_9FLAO|nr:transglutaminase domain-containing protein [Christiangramia gaetbulicola]PTX44813.1 hypothetical protein C8P64_0795 [Christiangramia gaetbulicola]